MTVSKDFPLASLWCTPFFLQTIISQGNMQNEMDSFYYFESSIHFASIHFANFSMKTRSTEKMEYTTTKPTENPLKLSSQFFLFVKLCHRDFSSQSNVKNHNFINRKLYRLFDKIMIFNITLWRKISVTKFQK